MNKKVLLFGGLILLTLGIILKITGDRNILPMLLIGFGVLLKGSYVIGLASKGKYKIGAELLVLALGLTLFFFGLYLPQLSSTWAIVLIVIGLSFKIAFVALFVRKIKK